MWYAVETAFIKGRQYKSRLLFDSNVNPDNRGVYPGTCPFGHHEEPHNTCQTFMDGEIEIHTDWFQTKSEAIAFANGSLTYIIHMEVWYDKLIRSVRSRFMKWESVPAVRKYLPYRGTYELHYRDGREVMLNELVQALRNAKNEKDKETAYRNLNTIGIDKTTADLVIAEMKV